MNEELIKKLDELIEVLKNIHKDLQEIDFNLYNLKK
jgi:hypothetical protein